MNGGEGSAGGEQRKDHQQAIKSYAQAASIYHLLNNPTGEATALNCIGLLHEQAAGVEGMFRSHGFARAEVIRLEGWTTLLLRRA